MLDRKLDVINELKKYSQFINESSYHFDKKTLIRNWFFINDEKCSGILKNKTFVSSENNHIMKIYDYSDLLNVTVTKDNYENLMNTINIRKIVLPDEIISVSEIKTIIENNIRAVLYAINVYNKIEIFKELENEFKD